MAGQGSADVVNASNKTVKVAGIDWAVDPKNRAMVSLESSPSGLRLLRTREKLLDDFVADICRNSEFAVIGIDTPFGWPEQFTKFVSACACTKPYPSLANKDSFKYRATDLHVRQIRQRPFSVSADKIGVCSWAWAQLCRKYKLNGQIDVVGKHNNHGLPAIIEVYPGATMKAFTGDSDAKFMVKSDIERYKHKTRGRDIREQLVTKLCKQFDIEDEVSTKTSHWSDHELDALVAALTALIYYRTLARQAGEQLSERRHLDRWDISLPEPSAQQLALLEGWIFFPIERIGCGHPKEVGRGHV